MTRLSAKTIFQGALPPGTTLNADFDKKQIDLTIRDKGYNVLYEKALRCPCKSQSSDHQTACLNCGGSGWMFVNATLTKMTMHSISSERKYQEVGREDLGMVQITALDGNILSLMDRITILDGLTDHTEILYPTLSDDGTKLFAFTKYNLIGVDYLGIFVNNTTNVNQLLETQDYTFHDNVIEFTSLHGASSNPTGLSVSIRYLHAPVYHVWDIARDTMRSTVVDNTGKKQVINLPIHAVGKRSHLVKDAENYTGTRLLDNSFLPDCDATVYKAPVLPSNIPFYFTSAQNIGTGVGVYDSASGRVLNFRNILAGANVTVTLVGSDIVISSTGGGGGGSVTSVSGTLNRITSTGGTTPVIDISANYIGQSSITTLGTIGAGIWQGTKVGLAYGGTNADLSATGGSANYLKQVSVGAAITVGTIPYSDITGTPGAAWLLASGGTLSAANTITANTAGWLLFNGTWTASANNQSHADWTGTITARATASDNIRYLLIDPTLISSAATQQLTAVSINPTFTDVNSATKYILHLKNAGTDVVSFGFDGATTITSGNSSTNPTLKLVGIGTTTNYTLRAFQSGGSTETFSIKDSGLFVHTSTINGNQFSNTWTATANNQSAIEYLGTVTTRNTNTDTLNYILIDPTMTRNAGNPTGIIQNAVYINPTFTNTASSTNSALRVAVGGTTFFTVGSLNGNTSNVSVGADPLANSTFFVKSTQSQVTLRVQGAGSTSNTIFQLQNNGTTSLFAVTDYGDITIATQAHSSVTNTSFSITQGVYSAGTGQGIVYNAGAHTNQAAEVNDLNFNTTRAVGFLNTTALANQRVVVFGNPTYSATSGTASAITVSTVDITGPAIAGSGFTGTSTIGLNIRGVSVGSGFTNSYGLVVNASTGATTNYAIKTVGSGTTTNYSYRAFQSDGTTEIYSLIDSGKISNTSTFTAVANNEIAFNSVNNITMRAVASDSAIGMYGDYNFNISSTTQNPIGLNLDVSYIQIGGINTTIASNSTVAGMTATTYTNVAPASTSGSGSGALFTVVVGSATVITSITQTTPGTGYRVNDTITFNGSQFGAGSGSAIFIIRTVVGLSVGTTATPLRINTSGINGNDIPKLIDFYSEGSSVASFRTIGAGGFRLYDSAGNEIWRVTTGVFLVNAAATLNSTTTMNGAVALNAALTGNSTATISLGYVNPVNGVTTSSAYNYTGTSGGIFTANSFQSKYRTSGTIGAGVSGVGIPSAISLTSGGTGYSVGNSKPTTGGTGTGFVVNVLTVSGGVVTSVSFPASVGGAANGSGYTINDVLTITTGGANATITVTAVDYAGTIIQFDDVSNIVDAKSNNLYISFLARPTYNITSTQTGTIAAFYYNPTLTNVGSFNNYGVVIGPSSAKSGFGTTSPTGTVHIAGTSGTITLKTVGAGTTTNYSIRSFQSDGTTEIFSLLDNGLATFGGRVITTSTATLPAINIGSVAGTPSTLATNGDMWYDSTNNDFRGRVNGTSVSFLWNAITTATNTQVPFYGNALGFITQSSLFTFTSGTTLLTTGSLLLNQASAATQSQNILAVTAQTLTSQTASETIDVNFNSTNTVTFTGSTGFATQRGVVFQPRTYAFASATGTLTDTATVAISGAPIKGANAALTNTHGLLIQAGAVSTATNSYGLTVNAQTGATNNYAAQFIGGLGVFLSDINVVLGTTTGTIFGTSTSQKLSVWNKTPIVQPTTGVATATRVGGGGTTVTDTDTFGGYKIGQIVQALQNIGLLA